LLFGSGVSLLATLIGWLKHLFNSFALGRYAQNKKAKIYIPRVVYMAQMKARQELDKSRKFVKTMIYIYRVVYTA
jgi:hypothetical protein